MTKKSKFSIMVMSLCLLILSGIVFIKPSLINPKLNNIIIENMHCSYFEMDLERLKSDSDIIIKGTVKEVRPSYIAKIKCIVDEMGTNHEYHKKSAQEAYENGTDAVFILKNEEKVAEFTKDYNEKNGGEIYTDKVVHVDTYYKNNTGGSDIIIVREPGGNINNRFSQIVGEEPLSIGDELVLFLKRLHANKYIILGGPQGKYYIEGDIAVNKRPEKNMNLDELEAEIIS